MPAFKYTAYNAEGKEVSGSIQADSGRHARRLLKEQKLLPSSVNEDNQQRQNKSRGRGTRLAVLDLSLLLRQLAVLVQSGLPLADALAMTIEQAETEKQRKVVERWRVELLEGRSLSEAMRRCGYQIPDSVIAGVGVGEESGHLHGVMERLADELETSAENKKTVTRALIYPATLIATSIIVVGVLMVWVVPKIAVIFESSRRELPIITRIVMGLSNFVQTYGVICLIIFIALVIGWKFWLRNPVRRERWHKLLLTFPGLGRWILMGSIADWSRSLGILLRSGVPALAALSIASSVVENLSLRRRFEGVTEKMRQGSSLQNALTASDAGSGFLNHMVGSGEAASELDTMLLRVAEYYSLRLKSSVEVFLKIMNPLLIVIMGLIILSVMAAVMLPIMDLNNII